MRSGVVNPRGGCGRGFDCRRRDPRRQTAAVVVREGLAFPSADAYPDMQARLVRYANQKLSG